MNLIDTHTHLYATEFDSDCEQVIINAINNGVSRMLLPSIDSETTESLLALCQLYPQHCFPMMGLHPTSVKENYKEELEHVEMQLEKNSFIAVGEIGIDLYWDKTFEKEQAEVFLFQVELAKKYTLPIVIHTRNSFEYTIGLLEKTQTPELKGVFHCFSGSLDEAKRAIEMNYKLGIGGVVTFKNSNLGSIVEAIDLKDIVLETDSPFLAPHPHRGKRNESAYLRLIAEKIAEIKHISIQEVAEVTTQNSLDLFFPRK